MVYSEEPTGTVEVDALYDDHDERSTYPNGTVARLICDKGYSAYRSTGVYDEEKQEDVYEKYVLTYTCDYGGWLEEGEDRAWLSFPEICAEESVVDSLLFVEPPKPAKEDDPHQKLTLADSVAQRIEQFYDKATHPEQVFLKRLFKNLATKTNG